MKSGHVRKIPFLAQLETHYFSVSAAIVAFDDAKPVLWVKLWVYLSPKGLQTDRFERAISRDTHNSISLSALYSTRMFPASNGMLSLLPGMVQGTYAAAAAVLMKVHDYHQVKSPDTWLRFERCAHFSRAAICIYMRIRFKEFYQG